MSPRPLDSYDALKGNGIDGFSIKNTLANDANENPMNTADHYNPPSAAPHTR